MQSVLLRLATAIASLVMFVSPSVAQTPSVVEEFQLVTEDARQASFVLRFSPAEPQFAPVNGNPSRPMLALRSTLRAPRILGRHEYKGLVRTVQFDINGRDLLMMFDTTAPARVTAEKIGNRSIKIEVRRVNEAEATGVQPIGSAGDDVVKASDLTPLSTFNAGDSYELVPLKYADVSEVIGLLVEGTTIEPNNVFIRREPGFGSPGANSQSNYVNPNQTENLKEDRPLGQAFPGTGLAIDRRLNAIWITGSPERIANIKQQIAMIDVPVDSVILETQFVELSETGARNVGIDFTNSSGQIAIGTVTTGDKLPFGSNPTDRLVSGQLQAAIYAQIAKGEGRIVSRPRIAAQSGSTAKIITGDAIPILTSIQLSGVNGVSQQVQYVNVGVTLQIAPRVSGDGFVTSKIYGVVSSVTGFIGDYPTISQREAETSASVRDGETFVIGGLTQENSLTTKSKVPILGDVPIAGELFKVRKGNRSRTELYIVITPHIVRHRRFDSTPDSAVESVGIAAQQIVQPVN